VARQLECAMSCEKSQPVYDGFAHFIFSINASPESLMAMFTLYCDDSGTHSESDVAVAACYLAPVEQWSEFKRNWDEVNARESFGTFHMADFVARKQQFKAPEWSDKAKRERTIRSLINVIRTRVTIGFSAAVVKSDYDNIILNSKHAWKFEKNHYAFAVRACIAMVDKWRDRYKHTAPIQYVFDRMTKGKGDIDATFNTLLLGGTAALDRYGVFKDCWSFQDKEQVIQLQAADIWAWETYRYLVTACMPAESGRIPSPGRKSYFELRKSPVETRYHLKRSLEELVRRLDSTSGV
jgi:hypothetical protein